MEDCLHRVTITLLPHHNNDQHVLSKSAVLEETGCATLLLSFTIKVYNMAPVYLLFMVAREEEEKEKTSAHQREMSAHERETRERD